LDQNPTCKINKPFMYSWRLFNSTERNYITIEREALTMVYALHKFKHYMSDNRFTYIT
jgi:hypothetical protein